MARIRSIKPEFWDSPSVAKASPWARLLFIALWNWADDYGRGTANLKELEGFAFPNDDHFYDRSGNTVHFRSLVAEVSECFGVLFYNVSGRPFYEVPTWDDHQRNERRSKASKHPGPDQADDNSPILTCANAPESGTSATTERKHRAFPLQQSGNTVTGTGEQGNRGTEEQGSKTPSSPATPSMDSAPDFSAWYEHYPRKVGKQAAEKAYLKARKTVTAAQLLLAVRRYAADPNLPEQQFIPHPSKWLNDGRWDDGPLPARRDTARPGIDDKVRAGMTLAQQLQAEEQAAENQKQIGA